MPIDYVAEFKSLTQEVERLRKELKAREPFRTCEWEDGRIERWCKTCGVKLPDIEPEFFPYSFSYLDYIGHKLSECVRLLAFKEKPNEGI